MKIVMLVLIALFIPTAALAEDARVNVPLDSQGRPQVDPTKNVLDLVEAAIRRQDDLRASNEKYILGQLEGAEKVNSLRFQHLKELEDAEARRIDSEAKLRADYADRLVAAEAKRIDAIRAVDVAAVTTASQRASDQATALATTVAQSAEALRGVVATTANSAAQSQQQTSAALSSRITTLEQAGYQAQGKQTISDPAFIALVAEVRELTKARADAAGIGTGRSDVIGWIAALFMGLVAFATVMLALFRPQRGQRA